MEVPIMIEKWLEGFARVGMRVFLLLFIVGTITLIAALGFSLAGTGTLTVQREPLVWLGMTLALYSLALGCLSVYLSFKKP